MVNDAREMVDFGNEWHKFPKHKTLKMKSERSERDQQKWDNRIRQNHFYEVTPSLLKEEDVKRGTKALKGTQKVHVLRVLGGKPGVGEVKDIFCPCAPCRYGVFVEHCWDCEYQDLHEQYRFASFPTAAPPQNDTRPERKKIETARYVDTDSDDEVLDATVLVAAGMFVGIRDYTDDNHGLELLNLLIITQKELSKKSSMVRNSRIQTTMRYALHLGMHMLLAMGARVSVAKRGYPIIEQWPGYPYLYLPKSYILHAGFHMTPYCGPGKKE
jgi:hypothetical protein